MTTTHLSDQLHGPFPEKPAASGKRTKTLQILHMNHFFNHETSSEVRQ